MAFQTVWWAHSKSACSGDWKLEVSKGKETPAGGVALRFGPAAWETSIRWPPDPPGFIQSFRPYPGDQNLSYSGLGFNISDFSSRWVVLITSEQWIPNFRTLKTHWKLMKGRPRSFNPRALCSGGTGIFNVCPRCDTSGYWGINT